MKKLYFLLVAIMVTTLSFGQELLTNGDLEAWTDATHVTGWTAYGYDQETTDIHGGTNAAKRDGTTNSGTKKLIQTFAITAGENYTVSFWYKIVSDRVSDPASSARIYGAWKDAADGYTDDQTTELQEFLSGYTVGEWTEYTATFDAPADAATMVFSVRAYGDSTVIWDDLSFMHNATPQPGLSVTSPSEGDTFSSGNDVVVSFEATNFDFATEGHVHYTVAEATIDATAADASDITLSGLANGTYTLFMELVNNSDNPLDPAVNKTVHFEVTAFTQVATIADLRASTVPGFYELTGEAFINFAQTGRHQKWIQDATAGILIDDYDGNITAGVRGEGISSIKGELVDYHGLLELKAMEDATITATPVFTPVPQVVTIAEILANGNDYEAELVKIQGAVLADIDGGDGNFQYRKNYPMTQGSDELTFRTNFEDSDYITTALPAVAKDIVGLVGEYNSFQFTARDLADFSDVAAIAENNIEGFNMYPNPVNGDVLNITTLQNLDKNVQIFDILGKQILAKTVTGTTINVANLNAGIYLIKVEEAGNTVTRKLVIR